jgi:5-methyltetrahydropteroyltriglutamate--homocysteine methyltransferase
MPLMTTTIGAYPKPDFVPVPNWSDIPETSRTHPTAAYDAFLADPPADTQALLKKATQQVVRQQDEDGVDVPTDGEIVREHYVFYHCRHLQGIDFQHLSEAVLRSGTWTAMVPTIRGEIRADRPFLARDWKAAQQVTDKPVKITVPGPMTIMDCTSDAYYGDGRRAQRGDPSAGRGRMPMDPGR